MFIDNIYTIQYYSIIDKARVRLPIGTTRKQAKLLLQYTERHHIIPKSLDGNNNEENLVWLTAEEHLTVHLLLPKMVTEEKHIRKMSLAAVRMANPQSKTQQRIIGDNLIPEIASIRKEAARLHSAYMSERNRGENNPFFGKNINGLGLTLASVPSIGGDFTFGLRGDIYKSLMLFGEVGAAKAIIQGGLAYRF